MIIGPHTGDTTANLNPIIAAFKEIGYQDKLIRLDYEFADFFEKSASTRQIKIGVFGQEPLNYRSAQNLLKRLDSDFRQNDKE